MLDEIDLRSFWLGVMAILTPSMLIMAWLLWKRAVIIEFDEDDADQDTAIIGRDRADETRNRGQR